MSRWIYNNVLTLINFGVRGMKGAILPEIEKNRFGNCLTKIGNI